MRLLLLQEYSVKGSITQHSQSSGYKQQRFKAGWQIYTNNMLHHTSSANASQNKVKAVRVTRLWSAKHKSNIAAVLFCIQLMSYPRVSRSFPAKEHTCAALCRWAGPRGGTQRQTPGWGWCRPSENEPQQVTIDTAAPSQTSYHQPRSPLLPQTHHRELIVSMWLTWACCGPSIAYLGMP